MPRQTIYLRGEPRHEEAFIASPYDITPGMLVELNDDGTVQPHSTEGGTAAALYARENWENNGAGIGDDIEEGDEVVVIFADKGDKINALTDDTVTIGDFLASAGDGKVQVADSTDAVIGVAASTDDSGRVHLIVI